MTPWSLHRSGLAGWAPDAAAVVIVTALLETISVHIPAGPGDRPLDAAGYLLLAAAGMTVGLCRRFPRATVSAATTVLACVLVRRYPAGPVWVTGWIALAALSWRTGRRTALVGAAAMLAVVTVAAVSVASRGPFLPLVFLGWSAAAVFLGEALRSRRNYLAGLRERARFLERTREEETGRRVAEERLRIARDLHDSVAHAMTIINVQAGAAVHVLERQPEAAGQALAAIQRASGEVLDELTAMLAVLRDDTRQADRAPVPGMNELGQLVDASQASGLTVTLSTDGPVQAVPGIVGTAVYRVVQESLTNVMRHSQARTARVRMIAGQAAVLVVEVSDPGPPARDGTVGTRVGIRGMRERVTSTGGSFQAGPTPRGGFLVRAAWDERP